METSVALLGRVLCRLHGRGTKHALGRVERQSGVQLIWILPDLVCVKGHI